MTAAVKKRPVHDHAAKPAACSDNRESTADRHERHMKVAEKVMAKHAEALRALAKA
jgi:hypothetical protein